MVYVTYNHVDVVVVECVVFNGPVEWKGGVTIDVYKYGIVGVIDAGQQSNQGIGCVWRLDPRVIVTKHLQHSNNDWFVGLGGSGWGGGCLCLRTT